MLSKMSNFSEPIRDLEGRPALAVSAAGAKSIGQVLEATERGNVIAITRYGRVRAVLVPVDQYRRLTDREPDLGELDREFADMLSAMQSRRSRAAVDAVFEAAPAELGRAAATAARRRARRRSA